MIKRLLLTEDSTLDDALRLLDSNGNGFLPVVNEQETLIGIITDGDIRRAILNKNLELNAVINTNPTTCLVGTSHIEIKRKLRAIHRRHMPVVDSERRLLEVVVLDEFEFLAKNNWVVIMAGGLGTRLGELTKNTPKPMLSLGGKPILQEIITHFKSQGFGKFVICLNYKAEVIQDYFKEGDSLGVEIRYTIENKRLGTAGALSLIDFEMEDSFFVVNGDVLTSINYDDFLNYHQVNQSDATMCVKKMGFNIPYACVEFNTEMDLVSLKEKPSFDYFVNTGMYILGPDVLKMIPKDEYYDMPFLFEKLVESDKKTKVFSMEEYWLDLGKPEDFAKGNHDFKLE